MHGIKIPQQDFALKMPGGAYARGGGGGGCICGTLQYKHEVCSNTEISPKELKTICCYSNHSNFAQPLM